MKNEKACVDIYARFTEKIVVERQAGARVANATDRATRSLRQNGLPYSGMNMLLL